jgi:parallel beta-helix repeat protein
MAPVATCFIKNNSILENDLGLHMKIGNPEPGLCVISTNLFYNNTNGLYLGGEGTCVVENNRIYLSAGFGIELSRESVRGDIFFNITGNHLWNNKYGINGSASYDLPRARGEAYDNTFEDNDYGVSLIARTNVEFGNMPWDFTLSHNNFLGNTQQVYVEIQGDIVIPSGIVWDKGYPVGGNWWSDYSGSDVDGDGIGDSPYVIDATDRDNYPLMHPYARAPVVEWQKTYSLPPARSCQQTSDGGYILTGGSTEVYLLKTDSDGVIEWQKTYPEGRLQQGYSVQQTYDGGYIIAVCGDPYDDTTDYTHLIKTASNGTIQWKKSFGIFRDVYSARQTIDGGYIVVGRWNDGSGGWPGFVTKLDSYANIQWTQWFDDGIDGYRLPCVELGEFVGEYIVGGKSTSDAALIKLGSSGNILWERPFAFENTYTELDALVLAGDGGYAFGGFADSGTLVTAYIAKTDSSGTVLWTKAVDSLGNSPYRGGVRSMDQTADGGFILAGSKGSSAALVKTEANGNKQWNMTFGEGLLTSVQTISDGYIACGSSGGSASLLKIRLISTLHFSDGFESGDFVAWPGTYVTSDETASVTNTLKHHDVFSALFSSNGGDGRERSYCYESIFPQLELYARAYVRVAASGIVENDDRFYLIIFNAGNSAVAFAGWRRTGGVLKWNLVIRNGTGWVNAFSSASPSLNQWYCVELHWKKDSTNGLGELWVDGVLVCSASGRNTAYFGDANRVDVGLPEIISCASTQAYIDCTVFSAAYIGLESAAPAPVFADDFESGSFNAWTASSSTAGETANVVGTIVHYGAYAGRFASNGNGGTERAYCYKTISSQTELYVSGSFRVAASGLVEEGDRFYMVAIKSSSSVVAFAGWRITGGVVKWNLVVRHGTGWVNVYSSASPVLNQWYDIQLHWKSDAANGLGELYVNGVLACSSMGKNTANYGSATRVDFGLPELVNCGATEVYGDTCKVSVNPT